MEAAGGASKRGRGGGVVMKEGRERWCSFQMPLHYPKLTRADYEAMPEEELDRLLTEYGLPISGNIHYKRTFAMGAFLWPSPPRLSSSLPFSERSPLSNQ